MKVCKHILHQPIFYLASIGVLLLLSQTFPSCTLPGSSQPGPALPGHLAVKPGCLGKREVGRGSLSREEGSLVALGFGLELLHG